MGYFVVSIVSLDVKMAFYRSAVFFSLSLDSLFIIRFTIRKTALPKIPVHPATNFRVWVIPIHGALIAGIHAGAAFDAVLDLKMHFLVFV